MKKFSKMKKQIAENQYITIFCFCEKFSKMEKNWSPFQQNVVAMLLSAILYWFSF